jgi:DUF4097 and DUF4098 domain-containing protein YvlB
MKNESFKTGKAPHITISECNSDLLIRGWQDQEVVAKGDDFKVSETDQGITVISRNRLRLMVPADATLSVTQVNGDLSARSVTGVTEISSVTGDAVLASLGDVKVQTVHSDLSLKKIEGAVEVDRVHGDVIARNVHSLTVNVVHGDLSARYVEGTARLGEVMGDINLRNVTGDVTIDKGRRDANLQYLEGLTSVSDIRGDIRLRGSLNEGKHNFTAAGDIIVRWPEDAPLNITATAPKIVNKLRFDEVAEAEGTLTASLNGGHTFVSLAAKGSIILRSIRVAEEKWEWDQTVDADFDFAIDLDGLGERISSQVNEQIARVTSDLESKFGPEYSQKMAERIAKKAERAAAKAERAAEKAMRRAERHMRRVSFQGRRQRRRSPSAETKKKASSEEQLKILKMVEKGIITTEEASTLLEALES